MCKPRQSVLAQREPRPPDLPIAQKETPLQMLVLVGSTMISHLTVTMMLVTSQTLAHAAGGDCCVHAMRLVVTSQNLAYATDCECAVHAMPNLACLLLQLSCKSCMSKPESASSMLVIPRTESL